MSVCLVINNIDFILFICFTCAYEHNIVKAIFCLDFVHHYLGELVVHICFDYDWSIINGVDRVEHSWMASGKLHNFIGEVLCCVKSTKCLAWTLWGKIKVTVSVTLLVVKKQELTSFRTSSCKEDIVLTVPGRG